MERKQYGLGQLTLLCLAAILTQYVVLADDDKPEIPEGSCYITEEMREGLNCSSSMIPISSTVYVEEQTYCRHRERELCVTCIDGTLLEMKCYNEKSHVRYKRGFRVRRIFRRRRRPPPPPPNNPPTITCPSISNVVAPPNSASAVVTWGSPSVYDREGIRTTQLTSGRASGTSFTEGTHTVSYQVIDTGGKTAVCSVSFQVSVIRCASPANIPFGAVQCATTIGTVLGTKCTYTCNSGYEISGSATVTCQSNRQYTATPACQKISCGDPPLPANAKSVSCTEGHVFESLCAPVCEQGYLPGRGANLYCPASGKWQPASWTCDDEVDPVFTNCPTKAIMTIDRNFRFALTATDNTGQVTVEQVQGTPEGTPLDFGSHLLKFTASDPTGNKAFCDFVVEMKATDCPIPSTNDSDITYTCNGMTATSVCQITCATGSRVEGSKYIACVRDKTGNNTSRWEPLEGTTATCYRASCPTLNTPKNGALVCDKKLGGVFCQIQCNEFYDVTYSDSRFHTFACDDANGEWQPRSTAPDCEELSFPDFYSLPTDYYYFVGDCSDQEAVNAIKQQFINNLNSIGLSPCMGNACSVDDVELSCGDTEEIPDFEFRRKRSTNPASNRILHVKVKIRVKNMDGTLSPTAANTLMTDLADKSNEVMSTNEAVRTMLYNSLPKPTVPPGENGTTSAPTLPPSVKAFSVVGNLTMNCAAGQIQPQPGKCVPCSIGSYADKGTCKTCPQNTYQNKSGSTSCEPCPIHHTTLSTGAISKDGCQELCKKDEFSPTGRAPCFPCPDEEHQPQIGSTTCLPCPGFHIVGRVSFKCLYRTFKPKNDTFVPEQLRVSNFLRNCDDEICLKF